MDYYQIKKVSYSTLKNMSKSPAYYKYMLENPKEPTSSMMFGSLIHSLYLPAAGLSFDDQFAVVDERITDKVRDAHAGKHLIKRDVYESASKAVASLNSHKMAQSLLCKTTSIEGAMEFERRGLQCKAKPDAICADHGTVWDLKTTSDVSASEFSKAIFNYSYHCQAEFYLEACRRCGLDVDSFCFVVVETNPPYEVAVYELSQNAIELGRETNERNLDLLIQCLETDIWPGVSESIEIIDMPKWAYQNREVNNDERR